MLLFIPGVDQPVDVTVDTGGVDIPRLGALLVVTALVLWVISVLIKAFKAAAPALLVVGIVIVVSMVLAGASIVPGR